MELADRSTCTGCGACMKVCPKQAIYYRDDEEGFPSLVIDAGKCVNCGLCNQVCPALHMPETHSIQKAYAAQLRDREALMESTSGGLFTAFSREIFRRGGVVYGCVWDENYNAIVRKAETEEEMKPMRGSKYVWSWAGDTFPEIKAYLEAGRTVLFTGLPCQAAGLKNYLRKEYPNLYLMDCLCSGSPSPMAFHRWLETLCSPKELPSLDLKFRNKLSFGVGVHITYTGQRKKNRPNGEHITNPYYYSFYSHLIDRRSCYRCQYGTDQRFADLTIGDYWGIQNYHRDMDIKAGVSALLVNSERGQELLDSLRDTLELKETEVRSIAKANNLLCGGKQRSRSIPEKRDAFFAELMQGGWKAAERKYLYDKTRLKLLAREMVPEKVKSVIKRLLGK